MMEQGQLNKNKPSEKAPRNFLVVSLFLFAFFALAPFAYGLDEYEIWGSFGRDNLISNSMGTEVGYYSTINFTDFDYTGTGSYYQPLIGSFNLSNNNQNLIFMQSPSYLFILDDEMNILHQETETWLGQPAFISYSDLNNNSYETGETYIIGHNDSHIKIYGFNTSLHQMYSYDFSANENMSFDKNGIKCTFYPFDGSERCFIQYQKHNGTNTSQIRNGGLLSIVIPNGLSNDSITWSKYDTTSLNHSTTTIPSIGDLNDDGTLDILLWNDNSGIVVIEGGTSVLLNIDSIDGGETDDYGYNNPIMIDINGGQKEIFFTSDESDRIAKLRCYDSSGAACSGFPITTSSCSDWTGGTNHIAKSNVAVIEYGGNDSVCIASQAYCTGGDGQGDDEINFACYGDEGVIYMQITCDETWTAGNSAEACANAYGDWGRDGYDSDRHITMGDYNGDNYDDMIANYINSTSYVLDIYQDSGEKLENCGNSTNIEFSFLWGIPVDSSGDIYIDILTVNSSKIENKISTIINSIPELTGSFGYDFGNPICVKTTLRFDAQEDSNYEQPFSEAYDEERIAADCWGNDTVDYGSYDSKYPYYECYYEDAGNYYADLYIQDEFNDDDFSEYETVLIQVINGTPGVTCNIIASGADPGEESEGSSAEQSTNDAIENTFGELFGSGSSSDKLKMIVGIALIIGIIMAVAAYTSNGIVLAAVGILAAIMITFMGLLPVSVLLIILVSLVLLIFIGSKIMGGSSQGGG